MACDDFNTMVAFIEGTMATTDRARYQEHLRGCAACRAVFAAVRRWFGPAAGFIAGAVVALTPVAVLMFRYNQPDAMMTLLIVVAAYCVTRALDDASTKWLTFAGVAIGFSFLVKGLQPFTVVPALALAYTVAAPTRLRNSSRGIPA